MGIDNDYINSQARRAAGCASFAFGFASWGAGLDWGNAVLGSTLFGGVVGYGTAMGLAWWGVRSDHPLTIANVDEPRPSIALPTAPPIRQAGQDVPVVNEANAGRYTVTVRDTMSPKMLAAFTAAIDSGKLQSDQISGRTLAAALGVDKNSRNVTQFLEQMIDGGWLEGNGSRWKLKGGQLPHSQQPAQF